MSSELKVKQVFEEAEEDLKDVQFTWLPGMVLNPLNHNVVMPVTNKASDVVPAIVQALPIPYIDEVSSTVIGAGFGAARLAYSIFPFKVDDEDIKVFNSETDELFDFDIAANLDMAQGEIKKKRPNELKPSWSFFKSVIGFAANSALDILRLPFSGDAFTWFTTTMKFVGYLTVTGIGLDLIEAFFSPGAVTSIQIIAKIQEEANEGKTSRRERTAMPNLPKELDGKDGLKDIMKDAVIYVRYASAAYGVSMINHKNKVYVGKDINKKKRKTRMSRFIGIPEDKMIDIDVVGGDIDIIKHFLAVDDRKKAVVLALRGTYTISGVKSDAAFYSRKYCNGVAHAGIADRADNIWNHVKDKVVKLLKENSGYDFVITGHSLGAGTAALVALKLEHEKTLLNLDPSLDKVNITCFAFAPPPVYLADPEHEEVMAESFLNIHAFIHENDVVPFLSVDSVRRSSYIINEVDKKTNIIDGPLMAMGIKEISPDLKKVVFEDPNLSEAWRAEKLAIPAPYAIWMQYNHYNKRDDAVYDVMFCRPQGTKNCSDEGTNDLQIFWDIRMVPDHMNPQ